MKLSKTEIALLAAIETGDEERRRILLRRHQAKPGSLKRVAEKLVKAGHLRRAATGPGYLLGDTA